jgi:hypothetical protein
LAVEPTAQTEKWDVSGEFDRMRSQIRTRNTLLRMGNGLRGMSA